MKTLLALGTALALTLPGQAGIAGWLTAETRSWAFVQRTGGIRIAVPLAQNGHLVLPVDYWPTGNSGLVVRRIDVDRQDRQLVLSVVTQVVEKGCATGRTHFADLSGIPPGTYEVYYETAGDPAKHLGRVVVK